MLLFNSFSGFLVNNSLIQRLSGNFWHHISFYSLFCCIIFDHALPAHWHIVVWSSKTELNFMREESGCFPNFTPLTPNPHIFFHQTIFLITQQKLQQPDFKEHQKFCRETNITLHPLRGQKKRGCTGIRVNTQKNSRSVGFVLDPCHFLWLQSMFDEIF